MTELKTGDTISMWIEKHSFWSNWFGWLGFKPETVLQQYKITGVVLSVDD